jgi:hypothetical protein
MSKMVYTCPDCGSQEVHWLIATWEDANTGEQKDCYGLAALYPEPYWCDQCVQPKTRLVEAEVDEDPEVDTSTFANHDGTFADND